MAARSGVPESIIYLLANGADIASIDQNGYTPLHALAEFSLDRILWDTNRVSDGWSTGMIKLDDETRLGKDFCFDHETNEFETLGVLLQARANVDAKAVFEQRAHDTTRSRY